MKLSFILVIITILQTNAASFAQKITISEKNAPLEKILKEIRKQSGYDFFYNAKMIKRANPVNINLYNVNLEEALQTSFKGQPFVYYIENRTIMVKPAKISFSESDPIKVTGVITDEKGLFLPGATIKIKGTNKATVTNSEGKFTIAAEVKDVLVISFTGFNNKEVTVTDASFLTIKLDEKHDALNEVVVVAFGQQKKVSVVGAITTIKPEELKNPTSQLTSGFGGRLAGVITSQPSGEPGSGAQFWIRGVATYGGTGALIFLNGIEISAGDLNSIDPANIESFSILKDASSTALYGARGANGVILVETKHGKILDKPKISALIENSITSATKMVKFADGVSYMNLYNEALKNDNPLNLDRYSQEKINGTANGLNPYVYPNVDWYDLLFKKYGTSQHANLNVQGGGKFVRYYMGLAYYKDQGVLNNGLISNFKNNIDNSRYNFVNNINVNVTKTTELELNINADFYQNTGPLNSASSLFQSVMGTNAVDFPAYYPDPTGKNDHIYFGNKTDGFLAANMRDNPYADMVSGYSQSASNTVISTLRGTQKLDAILPGLSFNGLVSFKNWSYSGINRSYSPYYYTLGSANVDPNGQYIYKLDWINAAGGSTTLTQSGSTDGNRNLYLQANLNYNHTFSDVHDVSGMLVFLKSDFNSNSPGSDIAFSLPSRKQGLAGRIAYGYKSRYFAEANLGYTGSENFAAGHRYGFFPAVGLSYVLSNESFFKGIKALDFINQFKLRASYGLSGNDQIGGNRFPYLSIVNLNSADNGFTTGFNFDNNRNGIQIKRYPNDNITWEISKKLNIGLDLGVFNGLLLNIDWFREVRNNIYQQRNTIPATVGVVSALPYVNIGRVLNRGIDATLNYSRTINKDMYISARGTFTYARNKILYKDEPNYSNIGLSNLSAIGLPINTNWGLVAERLFIDDQEVANSPIYTSATHAGDIKYLDLNRDGKIDDNDKIAMGYPSVPEIVYGCGFNIGYKKVDIGVFFQGTAHVSNFIGGFRPFGRNQANVLADIANSHWSVNNQDLYAFYPRLTASETAPSNEQNSSWWIRDFSYIRLKQAEIGYTPKKFVRIYLRGLNLLTFSKFKMWDPEQGGGNGLGYPPQRIYNIGAQFNL